jgi:hypothetical protein
MGKNYRGGYLQRGAVGPRVAKTVLLSADDQAINPNKVSLVYIQSDNTTATNRTFTLLDGQFDGQDLVLNFKSGSSFTCDLQSGGNVQLVAAWQPLQYENLHLMWDGTQWCEVARSETSTTTLSDGDIFVGNGSNIATGVTMSGDATLSNTGVITIAASAVEASMLSDTDSALKLAVGTFTAAALVASGTGVPTLAGPTIPDNAVIVSAWYEVKTTFAGDGDDSSTISIGVEDQDVDLVAASAIKTGTPWDATGALVATVPVMQTVGTFVKTSAARQIAVTLDIVSTDTTLSAGEMNVYCLYVVGVS